MYAQIVLTQLRFVVDTKKPRKRGDGTTWSSRSFLVERWCKCWSFLAKKKTEMAKKVHHYEEEPNRQQKSRANGIAGFTTTTPPHPPIMGQAVV